MMQITHIMKTDLTLKLDVNTITKSFIKWKQIK